MYQRRKQFFLTALIIALIAMLPVQPQTVNAAAIFSQATSQLIYNAPGTVITPSPELVPLSENIQPTIITQEEGETSPLEQALKEQSVILLIEQLRLNENEYSLQIQGVFIEETSARVDVFLKSTTEIPNEGRFDVEEVIHLFALHNGTSITALFREPSPDFYVYADQVSPSLLPSKRLNSWKTLRAQELSSTEITGQADVDAQAVSYYLPFAAGTRWPVYQDWNKHFDFSLPVGTTVLASRGGAAFVKLASSDGGGCDPLYDGYNNYVRLTQPDGTYAWYLHLKFGSITVNTNSFVNQGQSIGLSGMTGYTCGAHLHFNVSNTSNNAGGDPYGSAWVAVTFVEGAIAGGGAYTPYSQNSSPTPPPNSTTVHPALYFNASSVSTPSMCSNYWYATNGVYLTVNTNDPGLSTNYSQWSANLTKPGQYKVEAYIGYHSIINWQCPTHTFIYDTSDARYTIYTASGTKNVSGNQRPLNNEWLNLGTYQFNTGSGVKAKLSDLNGESNGSTTISVHDMRFTLVQESCYSLTLTSNPTDGGIIGVNPQPNCNNNTQYSYNTQVTLNANPENGYQFTGWSGNASGSSQSTTLTMNGNKSVTASFSPVCYTLTTAVNPANGGTVNVSPGPNCNNGTQYTQGTSVQLSASAASGYQFANWSGDSTSTSTPLSATMNANHSFTGNYSLAVFNTNWMPDDTFTGETGASTGQIRTFLQSQNSCLANEIADTDGQTIDVPALIRQYAQQYQINPKILLATMQKEQSAISSCPNTTKLSLLMGASGTSTARGQIAASAGLYRAYLDEQATGGATRSGWVVGVPKQTQDGVMVTPASKAIAGLFTYTPYAGVQWGGNIPGVGGTALFKAVWDMYDFDQAFPAFTCYNLTVTKNPEAGGSVSISPDPSSDCSFGYEPNTSVQLTASPTSGYKFNYWTGDVSSASAGVSVVMNAAKQLTAYFQVDDTNNPVPLLSSVSPSNATAGPNDLTVTISGTGYVNNSVVRWNGSSLATTYISSTALTAVVPSSELAAASTATLTVFNPAPGGGASGSLSFSVTNPAPVLSSVDPATVDALSGATLLTLGGSGFLPSSQVLLDGSEISATYVSANSLTVNLLEQPDSGTLSISVRNSTPGGGDSATLSVSIQNPVPALTSIAPASTYSGANSFTLIVYGSKFMSGASIRWNGSNLTTIRSSASTLRATIPPDLIATAGTAAITVFNDGPGGGKSDALTFSILNRTPTLTNVSPGILPAEGESQTLTLTGTQFSAGSTVLWDNTPLPTTFDSNTRLTAEANSSLLAVSGNIPIQVSNPEPGGGTSNNFYMQIRNPNPVLDSILPAKVKAGSGDTTPDSHRQRFRRLGRRPLEWD